MGPKPNLWNAVKVAKNQCPADITINLILDGVPVLVGDVAGSFTKFFYDKVKVNVAKAKVDATGDYNGKCKLFQNQYNVPNS